MSDFRFVVRKWVKPEDLNPHGTLFGGRLLQWIDEEAAILSVNQLGTRGVTTRFISEVSFVASARRGDLLQLEFTIDAFGRTSLTLSCRVENAVTGEEILTLDRIVFVALDAAGRSAPHGWTTPTTGTDRVRTPHHIEGAS